MYLAEISTAHFQFIALGESESQALSAIADGYDVHARQSQGMADPDLMREAIAAGDVNVYEISPGACLRDGSQIYPRPKRKG